MKTRFRVPDFVEIKDLFKISCDCILVICASPLSVQAETDCSSVRKNR